MTPKELRDADELLTMERFTAIPGARLMDFGAQLVLNNWDGGHIFLTEIDDGLRLTITGPAAHRGRGTATVWNPTLGQLRDLCRALGVALPEVPA
jgi:hypothetical protein